MKIVAIDRLKKDLDFSPLKPWPASLPPVAWGSQLLCGFDSSHPQAIDLSAPDKSTQSLPPANIFAECHPGISLPEMARWLQACRDCGVLTDIWQDAFFEAYGLRPHPNLLQVIALLPGTPRSFQDWCSSRGVGANDLAPLRAASSSAYIEIANLNPILEKIAALQASKSIGCQLLEWTIELLMMGHTRDRLSQNERSLVQWHQEIRSLRFSKSTHQDQSIKEAVRSLPWPAKVWPKVHREGDRSVIELKIQFCSPHEFQKRVSGINEVCQLVSQQPELLWKS